MNRYRPIPILFLSMLFSFVAFGADVSGRVVNTAGEGIASARVFAEPGLGGAVLDTLADSDGRFLFADLPAGQTGIFTAAPGFGFGGVHLALGVEDQPPGITITLHPATTMRGVVLDSKGNAISGARITRIGLTDADKVGIPLSKLTGFGYAMPESGSDGHFSLPNLPAGGTVALKVGHPSFAQEGVADLRADDTSVRVTLYPGVLVQGEVLSRERGVPVANAGILIQNAVPPHDSAVTDTGATGTFNIRLKPGVYLYQATGSGARSPGWSRLVVTGETAQQRVRLSVAGTGWVRGTIKDAVSGGPIAGARVVLSSNGQPSGVVRTSSSGVFRFPAAEGKNTIQVEAAQGYMPPPSGPLTVTVMAGQELDLPEMWLAPVPDFRVRVVDEAGLPVPGAILTLLQPEQFGWRSADADGWVSLRVGSLPPDGKIIGRAEDPGQPRAALFQLTAANAGGAEVQLFELGRVSGTVTNSRGKELEGAQIGGVFPGVEDTDSAMLLWRGVSGPDGAFQWNAIVPGVPQRCLASTGPNATGQSMNANLAPGEHKDLGRVIVEEGEGGESLLGERFDWNAYTPLCGTLPDKAARSGKRALVMFVPADNADIALEVMDKIRRETPARDWIMAVVVNGLYTCGPASGTVLRGTPPGVATSYLLDTEGRVVLETFGLPPLQALQLR